MHCGGGPLLCGTREAVTCPRGHGLHPGRSCGFDRADVQGCEGGPWPFSDGRAIISSEDISTTNPGSRAWDRSRLGWSRAAASEGIEAGPELGRPRPAGLPPFGGLAPSSPFLPPSYFCTASLGTGESSSSLGRPGCTTETSPLRWLRSKRQRAFARREAWSGQKAQFRPCLV